jgi:hypothetical protein
VRAMLIAVGHLKPSEGLTDPNAGVVGSRDRDRMMVATMRFDMFLLSSGNTDLSRVHTPPLNVKQIRLV